MGGIDIVVINAGIPLVAHLKDIDLEAFRKLEKVNVEGTLLTLSQIAHHFILQNTGGDIVIVSTKNVPSPRKSRVIPPRMVISSRPAARASAPVTAA